MDPSCAYFRVSWLFTVLEFVVYVSKAQGRLQSSSLLELVFFSFFIKCIRYLQCSACCRDALKWQATVGEEGQRGYEGKMEGLGENEGTEESGIERTEGLFHLCLPKFCCASSPSGKRVQ